MWRVVGCRAGEWGIGGVRALDGLLGFGARPGNLGLGALMCGRDLTTGLPARRGDLGGRVGADPFERAAHPL